MQKLEEDTQGPASYLSKTDFTLAHTCPTKLFYRKRHYPNELDKDEYFRFLARGGYMVGKLATLLYPGGILIATDAQSAVANTMELLKREAVVLFEAAIENDGRIVSIDILKKEGNSLQIIEAKSKSYRTPKDDKERRTILKELDEKILDVAFQYSVVKDVFPEYAIESFLLLPDKAKRTKVDGLNLLFRIEQAHEWEDSRFKRYEVSFDDTRINDILIDDILTLVPIQEQVTEYQDLVKEETKVFLASLKPHLKKVVGSHNKDCFKCEFSVANEGHPVSGFDECWQDFPVVKHHIKDIYHIGTIGGYKHPLADRLIEERQISFADFPIDSLSGKRGERQLIQIRETLADNEWRSATLKESLISWNFPIRFIDFETSTPVFPFHRGMRPYEVVAFQWSCHTINGPGQEPTHTEWINLDPEFPNFTFAEALMRHVGTDGTFLMWAPHENTILRSVYRQCEEYSYGNSELKSWLEEVVRLDTEDTGKFVDMNKFTLENYFHPLMKGKTSLKWTLPAVLSATKSTRVRDWLARFEDGLSLFEATESGGVANPYNKLPAIEIYATAESIQEGTGAMTAYEDMMFGLNKGDIEVVEKYRKALLRYCKLDTLAMVIVWEHWNSL